jgi:hypothetical protein
LAVNANTVNVVQTQANIRAAIARSRHARNALERRRRRIILAACASAAAAFPLTFAAFGVSGNDVVHAAAGGAQNLADLLGQRSPGERTQAALTKTKHARALAKQRHFPVPAPPPAAPGVELAMIVAPPPGQLPVDFGPPVPLLAMSSPPPASFFTQPGGGGIVVPPGGSAGSPPGGGGGSPPGGGGPNTVPTPQPNELVPSAVPEPGTWATMLLGFAIVGWCVRRSRTRALSAAVS